MRLSDARMPAAPSLFRRIATRASARVLAVTLAATCSSGAMHDAQAYAYGSGVCDAVADGGYMSPRLHHPGDAGGFAIRFDRPDYLPGERIGVQLSHAEDGEVFSGFLLYAENAALLRHGVFTPIPGTTLSGMLPAACAHFGHTITHLHGATVAPTRARLRLSWRAPLQGEQTLTFRALVLRADPSEEVGTDFYEVQATLPQSLDGVFRDRFEALP
jgi:hypothetical protein